MSLSKMWPQFVLQAGIFCVMLLFAHYCQAGAAKTGFLVMARDRGFLGNQEIVAIVEQFRQAYPARLALVGYNQPGVKTSYDEYIHRAVSDLERVGAEKIIAIPFFLSDADPVYKRYRDRAREFAESATLEWAPAMAESYLTAQILLDRVEELSTDPTQERLIIVGTGAMDEASHQEIKKDIDALLGEITDRHRFEEIAVHVYYDQNATDAAEKNRAIDEQIVRTAAKRGHALLVPFFIGVKFDQRMSREHWLAQRFAEFRIDVGKSLLPHSDLLTWLEKTANRHSPASMDQIGVLIMPHGSIQPYNDGLETVITPLRKRYRVEVAPGMGDPLILGQAVRKLERDGIKRIIFIRMYAMEESMKAKTDYILGLSRQPPGHHHRSLPPRIRSSAVFYPFGGYEEDPLIAEILEERILEISEQPKNETVILLAHGAGDDETDKRWIDIINGNIERIREKLPPFRSIEAMTMREDWPDKRRQSLEKIRRRIEKGNQNGGRVLIVSNRLYGSGPYQRLLGEAGFKMNHQGLVPHPNLTRWLEKGIEQTLHSALLPAALPEKKAGDTTRNVW